MLCTFTNMFYDNQICRTRLNTHKNTFCVTNHSGRQILMAKQNSKIQKNAHCSMFKCKKCKWIKWSISNYSYYKAVNTFKAKYILEYTGRTHNACILHLSSTLKKRQPYIIHLYCNTKVPSCLESFNRALTVSKHN